MKNASLHLFFIFSNSFSLVFSVFAMAENDSPNTTDLINVGVILDMETRVGKMSHSCITMALSDFYAVHHRYRTRLVLHTRDSKGDPLRALSAATDLVNNIKVQAIIGPQTSDEAGFLANLGDKAEVPIVSFSATSPFVSSIKTPYFIRATQSDSSQVKAVAAIVEAFKWRNVVLVYEDTTYGNGVIPHLINALQDVNAGVSYMSIIPSSATNDQITAELYKMMTMQTRVYVVHMSSSLGSSFFLKVKELGMMSVEYAWITTDGLTNILSSMDKSVIDSMQGILGIRNHVPRSKELYNFTLAWRRKFRRDNPDIQTAELNVLGLWAYDAVWALAKATEAVKLKHSWTRKPNNMFNLTDIAAIRISKNGSKLLKGIMKSKFKGLSGQFQLINGQLQSMAFEIVNVIGKGTRRIGFWTPANGISKKLNTASYKTHLETIIWPGGLMTVTKGWVVATNGKKLRIGVPWKVGFKELVNVEQDDQTNKTVVTGFCIDVFNAAIETLPYAVPYEFVRFRDASGSISLNYNDLVYQVYLKSFDAVVGDTTITANRSLYVDFTIPYTELGIGTIVPIKEGNKNGMWIFLKPLTADLWLTIVAFFALTGFAVWVLEHRINDDFKGSPAQQLGMIFWFSFSTLVFAHRERVVSNLSRFVLIVWLFVVLILTSSYTANLTSILTVQQLQAVRKEDYIGYPNGSIGIFNNINPKNKLQPYRSVEAYALALSKGSQNGGVAAIINEIPYIKIFLAKYHADYTMTQVEYRTNGFGFVFPKGSPLVLDISRGIEKLREEGKLNLIERAWFKYQPTSILQESPRTTKSLNVDSFRGLFLITGISSTSAVTIFLVFRLLENWQWPETLNFGNSQWWKFIGMLKKRTEGKSEMDVGVLELSPHTDISMSPSFVKIDPLP